MMTIIDDYTLDDIKSSIKYLLDKSLSSEEVRQQTIKVTRSSSDVLASVYDWVKTNVRYRSDPVGTELFISPVRMMQDFSRFQPLAGDCDDIALLTVAMLQSVGVEAKVALLDIQGNGFDHAVAIVTSPETGSEIMIDPSTNKYPLGWEEHYLRKVVM